MLWSIDIATSKQMINCCCKVAPNNDKNRCFVFEPPDSVYWLITHDYSSLSVTATFSVM